MRLRLVLARKRRTAFPIQTTAATLSAHQPRCCGQRHRVVAAELHDEGRVLRACAQLALTVLGLGDEAVSEEHLGVAQVRAVSPAQAR